ncbi:hypothetical protein BgiBS90_034093 [Biomphalaria glabrata]|nr:hypothetical protein BgiBS90_034093 [Biomphalaria glabrata]
MLFAIVVFCVLVYSERCVSDGFNHTSFTTFIDQVDLEPVGCNETTMWSTTESSKIACAISCVANKTCAIFKFSSESSRCSLCHADSIQNLTFKSDKVYSWPYTLLETTALSTYYITIIREISVQEGIDVGSVIQLSVYFFPFLSPDFYLEFSNDKNNDSLFNVRVQDQDIVMTSQNSSTTWETTKLTLTPGTLQSNTTHYFHILVTQQGYLFYLDQSFLCHYEHTVPYDTFNRIFISGKIQILKLFV